MPKNNQAAGPAPALPTIPECGQPAVWGVFVGVRPTPPARYADLVATGKACELHVTSTARIFADAGFAVATYDLASTATTTPVETCGEVVEVGPAEPIDLPALLAKLASKERDAAAKSR
jgi:hypothetical protein